MIECKIITDESNVFDLAREWEELHECVALSPFTSHTWAVAWWQHIGKPSGAQLMVAICRDNGKLVGLIPFSIRKKGGVRILRLLSNETFYYRNFLIASPSYCEPLWDCIMKADGYDCACIKNIHEDTNEYSFFESRLPVFRKSVVYHYNYQNDTRQKLESQQQKSFRRKLRKLHKKLQDREDLSFGFTARQSPPPEVAGFLINRKKLWSAEKSKRGIYDEANFAKYYEELFKLCDEKKSGLYMWLKLAGEIVGATFSIIEKGTVYAHTVTYDPKASKLSPGNFLTLEEMIWAAENDMKETNFMEGHEEYKAAFTRTGRISCEYVYAKTLKGRVFLAAYKGLSALRRKLDRSSTKPEILINNRKCVVS